MTDLKIYSVALCVCPPDTTHVMGAKALFERLTGLETRLMKAARTDHGLGIRKGTALGFAYKAYAKTARKLLMRFKPEFFTSTVGKYGSMSRGYESYTDLLAVRQDPYVPDFGVSISAVAQWPGYGGTKRKRAPATVRAVPISKVKQSLELLGVQLIDE